MSKTIKTAKRHEAAYYLSFELCIRKITFQKEKNKLIPVFEFVEEGLGQISSRYQSGKAVINLTELEENLNKLEAYIKNAIEFYMEGNENDM